MPACRTRLTITDPGRRALSGLPFRAGQLVEIAITAKDSDPADRVERLRALLRQTQSLPAAQCIAEDKVAAEIAAYRAGR